MQWCYKVAKGVSIRLDCFAKFRDEDAGLSYKMFLRIMYSDFVNYSEILFTSCALNILLLISYHLYELCNNLFETA